MLLSAASQPLPLALAEFTSLAQFVQWTLPESLVAFLSLLPAPRSCSGSRIAYSWGASFVNPYRPETLKDLSPGLWFSQINFQSYSLDFHFQKHTFCSPLSALLSYAQDSSFLHLAWTTDWYSHFHIFEYFLLFWLVLVSYHWLEKFNGQVNVRNGLIPL